MEDKYGGEEGYRKHRTERLSYYPKIQKSSEPDTPRSLNTRQEDNDLIVKMEKVQDRVFPTLDLNFYNCLYTHECKIGPFYEDCLYDDDEMKLSSFVDHGVMFDPASQNEEAHPKVLLKSFILCFSYR